MQSTSDRNDQRGRYKPSRREFFKLLTAAGAGALVGGSGKDAAAASSGGSQTRPFSPFRKEHETIDDMYEISKDYKRMNQKYTIFNRGFWDERVRPNFLGNGAKKSGVIPFPQEGTPGYSKVDWALHWAGWAGHRAGTPLMGAGVRNTGNYDDWDRHANPKFDRYQFQDKAEATKKVKRAANFLGADLVGIAPYDERWTYSKWFDIDPSVEDDKSLEIPWDEMSEAEGVFPFQPRSVICMAFEMDYDAMKAPGFISGAAAGLGYSIMPEVSLKVAEFLNLLGYKSIPTGNDTGLSIPIAVQAGLGELSRMGLLITEKYGPRVRLAKVYTDLELEFDKPVSFGVLEFCKRCKKCAEACPSNAISVDDEPSATNTTGSLSSSEGVRKWYQHGEKCMLQWDRNGGTGCSFCISACPYNKLDTWIHDAAKLLVGVPVGRDIARQLDDAFGYGGKTAASAKAFWDKKI